MEPRTVTIPQPIAHRWPLVKRGDVVHPLLILVRNATVLRRPDNTTGSWVVTLNDADDEGAENTHWGLDVLENGGLILWWPSNLTWAAAGTEQARVTGRGEETLRDWNFALGLTTNPGTEQGALSLDDAPLGGVA